MSAMPTQKIEEAQSGQLPDTTAGRLSYARNRLGISQKQLGSAMGMSQTHLSNYENADKAIDMRISQLKAFALALKVTSDFLLCLSDDTGDSAEETALSIDERRYLWLEENGLEEDADWVRLKMEHAKRFNK